MDNTQPLGAGEVVLIIAVLLLIIGIAGRWDYDDALESERTAAEATTRKPTRVAAYRVTEQAAEVVVLRCIEVAD